jgi:diguanylate cyclase (GGDEF)-like protein
LELAALWVAISGHLHASLGRGLVAGAVAVSALLVMRQGILLRSNLSLLDERSLQALRDPLTGLLNRRAFQEDLEQLIYKAKRDSSTFSLLLVDLDGLKQINDGKGGHSAGDLALQELGRALTRSGRREDRTYRIGGDEFAVLYPGADRKTAQRGMTGARLGLEELLPGAAFCFGISEFPKDGVSAEALSAAADLELYRRKSEARKPDHLYNPSPVRKRSARPQPLS